MTSNQIAYAQLLETQRANKAKERETERSNKAEELETRRSNVAKEDLTRETNASRIRSPFGLISLFGERAIYGTDSRKATSNYVNSGLDSNELYENRDITAGKSVFRPGNTIKSIWDRYVTRRSRGGGRGN